MTAPIANGTLWRITGSTSVRAAGCALVLLALGHAEVNAAHASWITDDTRGVWVGTFYTYIVGNNKASANNIVRFEVDKSEEVVVANLRPLSWPVTNWVYGTTPATFFWDGVPHGANIAPGANRPFVAFSWAGPVDLTATTTDNGVPPGAIVHDVLAPDPPLLDMVDIASSDYYDAGDGLYHYTYDVTWVQGDPVGVAFEIDNDVWNSVSQLQLTGPAGWTKDYLHEQIVGPEGYEMAIYPDYLGLYTTGSGLASDETLTLEFASPYAPGTITAFSEGSLHDVSGPVPEPASLALLALGSLGVLRRRCG